MRESKLAGAGRHLAAFAVFAVLVGFSNSTLLPKLDRALPGANHEDPYAATWVLGWELRHLASLDFEDFWDPGLCYPDTNWAMTRMETHLGQAVVGLPFYLGSGRNVVFAYNIVFLLNLVLTAFAAYLLCRDLTRSWLAAVFGGAIFGLSPFLLLHRTHFSLVAAAPIPMAMLGLVWFVRDGRRSGVWLTGLSLIVGFYWQLQYGILLAAFCVVSFLAMLHVLQPKSWKRLAASFALMLAAFAIAAAPWGIQYTRGHRELGLESRIGEADYNAARLENLLASPDSATLGPLTGSFAAQETALYPSIAVLLLAVLGLAEGWRVGGGSTRESPRRAVIRRAAWSVVVCSIVEALLFDEPNLRFGLATIGVWTFPVALGLQLVRPMASARELRPLVAFLLCFALLLAFGPTLRWFDEVVAAGPYRLLSHLPVLRTMRAPGRYAIFYFLCLSILAASGVARLQRLGGKGWMLLLVAIVAWGIEASPQPVPLGPAPVGDRLPPVYAWLARQPHGPYSVLELPTDGIDLRVGHRPVFTTRQLMRNLDHRHPVTMLWGGYNCPMDLLLAEMAPWDRVPPRGLIDSHALRQAGVRYLVVHPRDFAPDQLRTVLAECERLECEFPMVYRDAESVVFDLPFWAEPPPAASLDRRWLKLALMPMGVLVGDSWSELGEDNADQAPLHLAQVLAGLPKDHLLLVVGFDEPTNALDARALAALRNRGLGARLAGNYGVAYAAATVTGAGPGAAAEAFDPNISRLKLEVGSRLGPLRLLKDLTLFGSTNTFHGGLRYAKIEREEDELLLRDRGLNFLLVDPETLELVDRFAYDTHRSVRAKSPASWLHPAGAAQFRIPSPSAERPVLSLGLRLGSPPWNAPLTLSVDRDGIALGHCEIVRDVTDCRVLLTPSGARPSGFELVLRADRSIVVDWARYLRPD